MALKINKTAVKEAKAGDKPQELRFEDGLILRVQPSGVRTYYVEVARGKRVRIGRVGTVTPAMAAEAAKRLSVKVMGEGVEAVMPVRAITLEKFIADVYEPFVEHEHRRGKRTAEDLRRSFADLLSTKLDRITSRELDAWVRGRREDGVKAATIAREANQLQGALRFAVERKHLKVSPFDTWKAPNVPQGNVERYLTTQEKAAIRKALSDRDRQQARERASANKWRRERRYPELPMVADHVMPMVLVLLNTGMRYGEVVKLEWQAVNLTTRTITVVGEKAKAGRGRIIQLNDEALKVLTTWRALTNRTTGLVFQCDGEPIKSIKTAWKTIKKMSGVENVRIHDLRHDFASSIVQRGGSVYVVQKLLGHGNVSQTMRYAHLADEQAAKAVALLDGHKRGGR
ncbi:Tyrosine recombinase XerC [Usitatibacter rugosus]|uniref:Tyrosine recombinase XerC n=1 Tax=Usitatibacter rugosus TaxID=2732067 RepID=A0A6M4GW24_9PROT|nr:site-specific integrase [Usitatibacter rugosus]QJR10694.1 Tyrosine recombinase XerC [Usitatibacter rugosus]